VLALTAWAAFAALRLTTRENARLRTERQLQPRRELLLDVVPELKELAAQVEILTPGVGYFDVTGLAARKHRLRVAVEFFPPGELPMTEAAAAHATSRNRRRERQCNRPLPSLPRSCSGSKRLFTD